MRGAIRRVGATALVASAIFTATPALQAEAETTPARTLQSLINIERAKSGRVVLRWSDNLARVALRHSKRMAAEDTLRHNGNLAGDLAAFPWRLLGENVGVGQSVQTLHVAFMNSPPHRRNVLDRRFRKMGVGVYVARERTWVTVVFYA